MAEDPTYDIPLEADQISTALQQVHNAHSSSVPADSDNMVRSRAVSTAIQTEATARSSADTALDGRVTAVENAGILGAPPIVFYTEHEYRSSTGLLPIGNGQLFANDGVNASLSSSTITVPAGKWRINISAKIYFSGSDGSPAQNAYLYVNGSNVKQLVTNASKGNVPILTHYDVDEAAPFTVGIYWVEGDSASAYLLGLLQTTSSEPTSPAITFSPFI